MVTETQVVYIAGPFVFRPSLGTITEHNPRSAEIVRTAHLSLDAIRDLHTICEAIEFSDARLHSLAATQQALKFALATAFAFYES